MDFLESAQTRLQRLRDELNTTGMFQCSYKFAGDFKMQFLDAHMDKLGMLKKKLIELLVEYRGILSATQTGTELLAQTMAKHVGIILPNQVVAEQITAAMLSYK